MARIKSVALERFECAVVGDYLNILSLVKQLRGRVGENYLRFSQGELSALNDFH